MTKKKKKNGEIANPTPYGVMIASRAVMMKSTWFADDHLKQEGAIKPALISAPLMGHDDNKALNIKPTVVILKESATEGWKTNRAMVRYMLIEVLFGIGMIEDALALQQLDKKD